MSPEFGSIKEYLSEYEPVLRGAQAHGPTYDPRRDVSGWVAFCVEAHLAQARQRLAQIEQASAAS